MTESIIEKFGKYLGVATGLLALVAGLYRGAQAIWTRVRLWRQGRQVRSAALEQLPALIQEVAAVRAWLESKPQGDVSAVLDKLSRIEGYMEGLRLSTWGLLDASGMRFWQASPDGSRTFISHALAALTEFSAQELLGHGWLAAVHPEDRARVTDEWRSAIAERRVFQINYRMMGRAGAVRDVQSKGQPVYAPSGEMTGFVGVVRLMDESQ